MDWFYWVFLFGIAALLLYGLDKRFSTLEDSVRNLATIQNEKSDNQEIIIELKAEEIMKHPKCSR